MSNDWHSSPSLMVDKVWKKSLKNIPGEPEFRFDQQLCHLLQVPTRDQREGKLTAEEMYAELMIDHEILSEGYEVAKKISAQLKKNG